MPTHLEQALWWWARQDAKGDERVIPPRHYRVLAAAGYIEWNEDEYCNVLTTAGRVAVNRHRGENHGK